MSYRSDPFSWRSRAVRAARLAWTLLCRMGRALDDFIRRAYLWGARLMIGIFLLALAPMIFMAAQPYHELLYQADPSPTTCQALREKSDFMERLRGPSETYQECMAAAKTQDKADYADKTPIARGRALHQEISDLVGLIAWLMARALRYALLALLAASLIAALLDPPIRRLMRALRQTRPRLADQTGGHP